MSVPEQPVLRIRHSLKPQQAQPRQPQPSAATTSFQVPPPAQPIPGVTGTPPLPTGRPVRGNPGQPLSPGVSRPLAAAKQEALASLAEMPLPVAPDTPPVEVPSEVDISTLPQTKQAELQEALQQARLFQQQKQSQRRARPRFSHPNVEQAAEAARQAAQAQQEELGLEVVDDRQPKPLPPAAAPAAEEPATEPETRTFAETTLKVCQHCGWQLHLPDLVEPTAADKQVFLQSMLGGIPFQKAYDLLGGELQVVLRSLRPDEVDICYQQCYAERRRGELPENMDFWESLMRSRFCFQLVALRHTQVIHELPADLAEWRDGLPEQAAPVDENADTIAKQIRDHVYTKVLKTESLIRLVGATTAEFNRLVKKLEDNALNTDFWKATPSAT